MTSAARTHGVFDTLADIYDGRAHRPYGLGTVNQRAHAVQAGALALAASLVPMDTPTSPAAGLLGDGPLALVVAQAQVGETGSRGIPGRRAHGHSCRNGREH